MYCGPLVSIIVPVFNVKDYLSKCLDSVLSQTYEKIEIILVDDGSTDGSSILCDEYKKKDNRICVFHQQNKGVSSARNLGLRNASGKYILFVDADDCISTEMVSNLLKVALETKAEVTICKLTRIYKQSEFEKSIISPLSLTLSQDDFNTKIASDKDIMSSVCNKLFLKKFIINNNIYFNERISFEEDLDYLIRLIPFCKKIVLLNEYLYAYQERLGSAVFSRDISLRKQAVYVRRKWLKICKQQGYNQSLPIVKQWYIIAWCVFLLLSVLQEKDKNRIFTKAALVFCRKYWRKIVFSPMSWIAKTGVITISLFPFPIINILHLSFVKDIILFLYKIFQPKIQRTYK